MMTVGSMTYILLLLTVVHDKYIPKHEWIDLWHTNLRTLSNISCEYIDFGDASLDCIIHLPRKHACGVCRHLHETVDRKTLSEIIDVDIWKFEIECHIPELFSNCEDSSVANY